MSIEKRFCKCGCNKRVSKLGNKYIYGHNRKGRIGGMFGKRHSKEARRKMSLSRMGDNNPMKRPEVRAKFIGENNPAKRPEVGKKISEALSGRNHYSWIEREIRECACGCGEVFECKINSERRFINYHSQRVNNSMSGKCWTKGHIEQMSKMMSGEGNPNWNGGISKLGYPFDFNDELKELIRKRDNYVCQLCRKTQKQNGRKLDVHHIDYNKENLNPGNLTALCRGCNAKVTANRKYWAKFFKLKLKLYG